MKAAELKLGDLYIYKGKYYVVVGEQPRSLAGRGERTDLFIKSKCFMSWTDPEHVDIGGISYLRFDQEVLLCEGELD